MPLIRVNHASPLTPDTVEQLISALTTAYAATTGSDPVALHVLIEQVPPQQWGVGGQSLAARSQKKA
ncbi:4-oxalocrotonate tautomerase family protein [Streptomyces sp. NPDC059224]|uniref:tautomerase family protein n=1 Tax=Streptomyces sp. NPDC059224 TaxID=3346775 RepID=UPI003686F755